MGLENRQYYRDDSNSGSWRPRSMSKRSMITTIIIINVGIFVLDMFSDLVSPSDKSSRSAVMQEDSETEQGQSSNTINPLMRFLALDSKVYQKPWKVWTLLSYGFAHSSINSNASFFHIGANMLVLFFLGRPIEERLGSQEFLKMYLAAIVVSGLGFVLLKLGSPKPAFAVGASGAVSAVVAIFIFWYPRQTLLLMGIIPMPAWLLGVLLILSDVMQSLNPSSHIAWQAHMAGFAFGVCFCYFNWNFNWLQMKKLGEMFKSKPSLKIHKPSASDKVKREADAILQKINDQGEESLTARERKILKKYSEQIRKGRD